MKIVITSSGRTLDSQVDPRFGRAAFFVVVDTDGPSVMPHDNAQNLNAVQGAGIQAARQVVELGAQAVLTGHVGPKGFAALQAAGVKVYAGATGTVHQAVEQFTGGQLVAASQATVEGHWM